MKYILMDYVKESGWPELSGEEKDHWLGAYLAYVDAMKEAGVLENGTGLMPTSTATTVRTANGKTQAALAWAARCPTSLHGVVEVRPIMEKSLSEIRARIATKGEPQA